MPRILRFAVAVALVGLAITSVTSPVLAHANLVKCSIKNHQVFHQGHVPRTITAHFAEELNPDHSWMAVFEGVADHGLVTEHTKSKVSFKHPKEMTLKLPKLQREKYYLIWYTHSLQDGHYAAGIVYFTVKK